MESLAAFVLASVLLSLAPGPDNLFVLAQSALHGPRAGLAITLGLCTGLLGHTALVAFGVAALLQTSPTAFSALRLLGAAYLLYLAWLSLRAEPADPGSQAVARPALGALYRRGVFMNLSNPKVALFFLAFLPQFADPTRGGLALQFVLLGALFILSALVVFALIALAAGSLSAGLRGSPRVQIWLNRVAAAVFAGLALRLALDG